MLIYFDEDRLPDEKTAATMNRAAELCLEHEDIDPSYISLSVSFVDGEEIRELNREYRGVDSVTDVLSFPQFEEDDLPWAAGEGGEIPIGDVVICEDRAREQAVEFGHTYERELIYLFVHSVFHLLGYDHMEEAEKREMRAAEESVMESLGITR